MQRGDLCFVSGVSGYLASHIARSLLDDGLRVRGSVRSLADSQRLVTLRRLLPGVEFVEADLRRESGWMEAVADADWVFHVATPQAVKTETDRTGGAIAGTRHLLDAVALSSRVRKVVITSSEAAVAYGHPASKQHFDERDWTRLEGLSSRADYHRSKTLAERLAWEWASDISRNRRRVPIATVNPTLILGPSLVPWSRFSLELLAGMARGRTPLLPDIRLRVVDVRDCAHMHIAVMANPACDGRRHLSMATKTTLTGLVQSIADGHSTHGFAPKARALPSTLLRLLAPLSPDLAAVRSHIGNTIEYRTLYPDVYRYQYRDLNRIVDDSMLSMLEHGWLERPDR